MLTTAAVHAGEHSSGNLTNNRSSTYHILQYSARNRVKVGSRCYGYRYARHQRRIDEPEVVGRGSGDDRASSESEDDEDVDEEVRRVAVRSVTSARALA